MFYYFLFTQHFHQLTIFNRQISENKKRDASDAEKVDENSTTNLKSSRADGIKFSSIMVSLGLINSQGGSQSVRTIVF